MARAARFAPATSSEASSTVRFSSWLMTDMTILIISCRRRMFLASCSTSLSFEGDSRALIRLPRPLYSRYQVSFDALLFRCAAEAGRCAHPVEAGWVSRLSAVVEFSFRSPALATGLLYSVGILD